MATLKPRAAQTLAAWAWAAVGLTPLGWFYGFMAIAYSHLGDVTDRNMMFGGVVLFAAAPTIAFILAIYAARARHRSGKIAVGVSGLLLLAILLVSAWLYGGWINVAVIAVTAVAAGLGFAWVRSRNKPPPGPDGARREVGPPAAGTPPGERVRPGAGRRDVHHLDSRGEHQAECLNERAAPRRALRACGITPTSRARTVCSGMPDASSAARCALIPAVSPSAIPAVSPSVASASPRRPGTNTSSRTTPWSITYPQSRAAAGLPGITCLAAGLPGSWPVAADRGQQRTRRFPA